jgi:PHD/YefM family antitoxin component YafN of YafNO toxin-antitoxin module
MRFDVLSVREARERLPSLLERFREGDRTPVFLGSHRKTEAVMLSIDTYNELTNRRRNAVSQGNASLRAEGMAPPPNIEVIVDLWVHGQITTAEMEERVAAQYGLASD